MKHTPVNYKFVEPISFVYLLDELNHMKLVFQLISLYDLIFNIEIEHIIFLLILYLLLLLKVLRFSCLEKLKLVLKLSVSLKFQLLSLLHLSTQMVLFSS